ncbi:CoA-binding protein [Leptospirillum ferriphilum]|uniref:CoA-binding n=2 Tax=Leptospirillum TaxID=179 RepID=A0A094W9P2_9BACT|nr:CoA-binding protein [Leptospirillum ferriphilum]EDZ38411.1 MAG: Putative CoA-binding protein [Leptospirillum sp. Group II '5-way CG']KGA94248.1 CoA-binding [Leptospirillum ferriphilum]
MTAEQESFSMVPSDETISMLIRESKTIAVVGISDKLGRPSLTVSSYLQDHGYSVLPVNPVLESVGHVKCHPSLDALPETPDMVVVFRKPADVPGVVREAANRGIRRIWIQEGIRSPEGYRLAKEHHMEIVMDRCIMKEIMRLGKDSGH